MTTMTLDEAIRRRHSVRGFLPAEVPEDLLREVFALAQAAPSNCNAQPWVPHVVSGPALQGLRAKLVAAAAHNMAGEPDWPSAGGYYRGVYRERQVEAARALYGALGIDRHDTDGRREAFLRNLDFFGAPHAAFVFMPRPFGTREATDLGIWAQTLMLALTSRGIGSCAQGALGLFPAIVREHLGLGEEQRLLFGISFGYEDPADKANAARIGRAPLEEAVRFHR